jgi:hypothetical protein
VILALDDTFGRRLVVFVLAGVLVCFGAGAADDNWDAEFGLPGADGPIWTMVVHGRDVYAAGSFTQIGGVFATNIAKWDGTNWSPLGAGLTGGLLPEIHALVFNGGELYAGGFFAQAGSVSSRGVARWDGTNWGSLAGGVSAPGLAGVRALAVSHGKIFAGGTFTTAGGVQAINIAAWDGTNWAPLGGGIPGTAVDSLTASETMIYAGGRFRLGGGINATNIAMWNGSSWLALGEGIRDWDVGGGGGGLVRTLLAGENSLIAAGSFRLAGRSSAINIAEWDGSTWLPLGAGIEPSGGVYALALNGTDLYAGGYFGSAGGIAASDIAKWDGIQWSALGSGIGDRFFSATVLSLAARGSELLVAGGDITSAGSKPANNIALWHIPHTLSIRQAQGNVVLSWPATGTNFLLEATSDVGAPNWQGVSGTPSIANDQCLVTLPLGPGNEFFRLRRK